MKHEKVPSGNIDNAVALGKYIEEQRKSMKLTQFEFASLCNVGTRFISELENGKNTIQIGKVFKILESIGVKIYLQPRSWNED